MPYPSVMLLSVAMPDLEGPSDSTSKRERERERERGEIKKMIFTVNKNYITGNYFANTRYCHVMTYA